MDLSIPGSDFQSPLSTSLTPVFGDNVQDLLNVGALHVNPSSIFTVNSIADVVDDSDGVTTLREAINWANADELSDLIVFERSVFSSAQTVELSLGQLDITHNLSIIAPRDELTGGNLLTVSGNRASRVFEIATEATVNLTGLIIANGRVIDNIAGGIKNSGTLTLDSSIVLSNISVRSFFSPSTSGPVSGGGIYNTGTLKVSNSTVSNNSTGTVNGNVSSNLGGGIYNTGTLEVSNCTISGNSAASGAGIFNQGTLVVSNSTLSSNSATARSEARGGGIDNRGTAIILNSTLNNNRAVTNGGGLGGGIYNTGILQVSNSTLNNNVATGGGGGGIFNIVAGTVTVNNSTISGNSARGGGGISNSGTLTVNNSTISGNSTVAITPELPSGSGGGISNSGTLTVNNSTITRNFTENSLFGGGSGGGISNFGTLTLLFSTLTLNQSVGIGGGVFNRAYSGTVNVRHTIIAQNFSTVDSINSDVDGNLTSFGYNLIGSSTGSTGFDEAIGDIVGTSDNPIDPRLAPLDFYGGPTQTIALLPDSLAIDAGDPTVLDTDPTTDGRGFPRVINGRADIGAFEFS